MKYENSNVQVSNTGPSTSYRVHTTPLPHLPIASAYGKIQHDTACWSLTYSICIIYNDELLISLLSELLLFPLFLLLYVSANDGGENREIALEMKRQIKVWIWKNDRTRNKSDTCTFKEQLVCVVWNSLTVIFHDGSFKYQR